LLCRSFAEFGGRLLSHLTKLGVVLHLCDLGITLDPESPTGRFVIPILVRYAEYQRRRVSLRNAVTAYHLKAAGRRCSLHPPYGWRYEKEGGHTVAVPDDREQQVLLQVGKLRADGNSLDTIRQTLAYELRLKNRAGRPFGLTEVRLMALR